MKRKILTMALGFTVFCCTLVSIDTISAYLADGDSARNVITVGSNNISIDEEFDPKPIEPGGQITKKVRIRNDGPNSCFVRARVVFSDSRIGKYANIDWNLKDWVYDSSDEYYYYKTAINQDDVTTWLMTSIQFSENIPEQEITDVDVIVYAESYQSFGFLDYREAWKDYQLNLR